METTMEEPPKAQKKRSKQADSTPSSRVKPFPAPPKSTIKHGTISQEKFWAYRKALPEEFLERLVFYVYREWPKLDFYKTFSAEQLAEMRAHKKRAPIKYIAKYTDIDPDDWQNHLLRFHGSGIYKINLNDSALRGQEGEICKTIIEIRDEEFSPVVDYEVLDLNDPANASFINDLRMKGILPGDLQRNEGEDMASTVAVEKLADALVKQSEAKTPDNTAANMLSDLLRQSEARHLKDLELAEARHVRDLEAITKRLEAAEKTAGAAPTTTQQVIEMARAIVPPPPPPPPGDNGMLTLLSDMLKNEKANRIEELKLLDARHAREMEALNKRLEILDAREAARLQQPIPVAGGAAPGGTSSAIKDVLAVLKGVNDLRTGIDGIGGDVGGSGNPWVDLATELGPRVLDTISTVTTAIRNTPAASPQSQQNAQVPGVPQIQQQQATTLTAEEQMIERIKAQLLQALGNNMHGSMFGGGIMFEYGDTVYNYLSQLGENGLMLMLQRDGVYWGHIQQVASRANIPQFIADFLNGPAVIERAQAIRAGQGQRPTGQVAPPPQQQARPAVVDAIPASQVQQTGGRTIIREGGPVKTTPAAVNGGVDSSV